MKRWEKIREAMDNPSRAVRAKFMFEIMEEERKLGVEAFKDYGLDTVIKAAFAKQRKEDRNKKPTKNSKVKDEEMEDQDE